MWKILVAALAVAAAFAGASRAAYPEKPINIIVPLQAGGMSTDILVRRLADRISPSLGARVLVENKAGAGGIVGLEYAKRQPADGYTLVLFPVGATVISPNIRKLGYDTLKDFAPITQLVDVPYVIVVNKDLPAGSLREFVNYAKARPGKLNFLSVGIGSINHFCFERLDSALGIELQHVPYKEHTMPALLRGDAHAYCVSIPHLLPFIRDGRVKALAVTGAERWHQLPEVPTLQEEGVKGFTLSAFVGLAAPAGTPRAVIDRLYAEIAKAMKEPEMQEFMKQNGMIPRATTPEQFTAFLKEELERYGRVAKAIRLKLE